MQAALQLAKHAQAAGEVPVGAILVRDQQILANGYNQPISQHDPTAHAEIIALRTACKHAQNYRLPNTTLYVTLEPCAMCAGALIQARISRVVFATHEPRSGAASSIINVLQNPQLNHQCQVQSGLYAQQSAQLLQQFFANKRK